MRANVPVLDLSRVRQRAQRALLAPTAAVAGLLGESWLGLRLLATCLVAALMACLVVKVALSGRWVTWPDDARAWLVARARRRRSAPRHADLAHNLVTQDALGSRSRMSGFSGAEPERQPRGAARSPMLT